MKSASAVAAVPPTSIWVKVWKNPLCSTVTHAEKVQTAYACVGDTFCGLVMQHLSQRIYLIDASFIAYISVLVCFLSQKRLLFIYYFQIHQVACLVTVQFIFPPRSQTRNLNRVIFMLFAPRYNVRLHKLNSILPNLLLVLPAVLRNGFPVTLRGLLLLYLGGLIWPRLQLVYFFINVDC